MKTQRAESIEHSMGQEESDAGTRRIKLAGGSEQQAAAVRGWRSGPAGLEVGGKTNESVVRCQWSVASEA